MAGLNEWLKELSYLFRSPRALVPFGRLVHLHPRTPFSLKLRSLVLTGLTEQLVVSQRHP